MSELPVNEIVCGDCLEVMHDWPDGCVDLVLTDPPYGISHPADYRNRGRGRVAECRNYPPSCGR